VCVLPDADGVLRPPPAVRAHEQQLAARHQRREHIQTIRMSTTDTITPAIAADIAESTTTLLASLLQTHTGLCAVPSDVPLAELGVVRCPFLVLRFHSKSVMGIGDSRFCLGGGGGGGPPHMSSAISWVRYTSIS
jgi:hypothetical protein